MVLAGFRNAHILLLILGARSGLLLPACVLNHPVVYAAGLRSLPLVGEVRKISDTVDMVRQQAPVKRIWQLKP